MRSRLPSTFHGRSRLAAEWPYLVIIFILSSTTPATAGGIELDSREYKMMLKPEKFRGAEPQQAVNQFAVGQLVPALRQLGNGDAAEELAAKGLKRNENRIIRFKDSSNCILYRHGFAWRERVDVSADGARSNDAELTLKFRSPDIFLASAVSLKAKQGAAAEKHKFEEDLGPVAVRNGTEGGIVASPRSARSQFSRSTTQSLAADKVPDDLAGIAALYPSFTDELRAAAGNVEMTTPLKPSPEYRELVYQSSKLKLVKDLKMEFALTLWYEGAENLETPTLAEISYKYKTDGGETPSEAARRALALLIAMQDFAWEKAAAPTKTAYVACD